MTTNLQINPALIGKYNRPGPRYTSYPTAAQFADVPKDQIQEEIAKAEGPLSLYVHVPFCETLCWYCGCHTEITRDRTRADTYLDGIEKEIKLLNTIKQPNRVATQLHLGGGTPNFLTPDQMNRLGQLMHTHYSISEEAECSTEIDPRHLSKEQVDVLKANGFNRASFGVQDCNPEVQKNIHRIQPHELNIQAAEWFRAADFESINIDLIYGLPGQSVGTFSETLDEVAKLSPNRVTVFSYAHVPWMKPSQKALEKIGLPSAEEKMELLMLSIQKLTDAGYEYIGMDHFARKDDELCKARTTGTLHRNFQGYSTRAGADIFGLGISSISQSDHAYYQNVKDRKTYYKLLDEGNIPVTRGVLLTDEDRLRRRVIHDIMCKIELHYADIEKAYGIDFKSHFAPALEQLKPMQDDGLLKLLDDRIQITDTGRLFIRNIAMCFDAYLKPESNRFSKTV